MDKSYYVRGKRITVEELDEVIAIEGREEAPRDGDESPALREAIRAQARRDARRAAMADTADAPFAAFEAAGWSFERRSHDAEHGAAENAVVDDAVAENQPGPEAARMARVFRHPTAGILLGTDQLTVRLDAKLRDKECRKILDAEGLDIVRQLKFAPNLYEVRVRPGLDFLDMSMRLHGRKPFVYAEPQFLEEIGERFRPTDPGYGAQWHWRNTGQNGGTAGADIDAETAWDITRGAGVRLAIIDKGFDLEHDDLEDAITTTSGFFDSAGKFVQSQDPLTYPFAPHGTFCAGMAVARANNGGGCGVANEADLIAVSCLSDELGTQATLARAVAYAANPEMEVAGADPADGAHVISCSLGPKNSADWEMKQVLEDAIKYAVTKGRGGLGTPVFWAVTNGNFEIRFDEVCSHANVIAVGRSTEADNHGNCGFGPELQFLAPGVNVVSTQAGGGLGVETGTSYAAPVAAGIAALVLSVNPALKWTAVRQIMRDTCEQVTGGVAGVVYTNGRNDRFGFGRVNAAEAVRNA